MPLEILDVALVLLRGLLAGKGAEITAPAGARIFLARIEPVLAAAELADHARARSRLRNAACALLILASCARRMAGVGFSLAGILRRGLAMKRSPPRWRGGEPSCDSTLRAAAVSGASRLPARCASDLPISNFCVSQEPLARRPATRSMPPRARAPGLARRLVVRRLRDFGMADSRLRC